MSAMLISRHLSCWQTPAITLLTTALLFGPTRTIGAQNRQGPITEIRSPEIFAHIGRYVAADDNGDLGSAISYGTLMVVPFSARWAADVGLQMSRVRLATETSIGDDGTPLVFDNTIRRTLVVPSLIYRFGIESVYGLVGGGLGLEFEAWTTRVNDPSAFPGSHEVAPALFERTRSKVNPAPSFRAGIVAFPTHRLGIRGDVYLTGYSRGVRVGIGYRFRRVQSS
jgi:putative cofactor-binding repeat protein